MISPRIIAACLCFFAIAASAPLFAQQELSNRIMADHPAFVINNLFVIEISPDPSKTEAEVQQASDVMKGIFGTQWNKIPVIQVDDHFVFMIGSNKERLNQICRNVKDKKNDLLNHLKGIGDGSHEGQFQVMFNPERLDRVFGISGRSNLGVDDEQEPADDAKLCWIGGKLQSNSVSAEVLLPIEQFQGFFRVMQ